uniref:Uncharacterized protein n=1 Tax=Rhodnius prolixus TaxID=13249 RepID=T1HDS6_RHOPR
MGDKDSGNTHACTPRGVSGVNDDHPVMEAVSSPDWMKQCVFKIEDRTQSMPIQSVVDVEAISSSTCIISTAPAADILTPSVDPLGHIHSFTFPAQLDSVIWLA